MERILAHDGDRSDPLHPWRGGIFSKPGVAVSELLFITSHLLGPTTTYSWTCTCGDDDSKRSYEELTNEKTRKDIIKSAKKHNDDEHDGQAEVHSLI